MKLKLVKSHLSNKKYDVIFTLKKRLILGFIIELPVLFHVP